MEGLEFNVAHLLQSPIGSNTRRDILVREPFRFEDISVSELRGSVELLRTNFGILGRADVASLIDLQCDRCLEPFRSEIRFAFAEEYLPVIDVSTGRPVQSERTDETFFISPKHVVDLTEAARQHLLLAAPMHRLCREECLGLCPTCGTNRNVESCRCSEETESPFSELAALLERPDHSA